VCTDNLDKTLLFCKHGFAYIKGEEADLNGVAIFHSDHPLALGAVESVQGTRVAIDMAFTHFLPGCFERAEPARIREINVDATLVMLVKIRVCEGHLV
jgi:hypothetical protein